MTLKNHRIFFFVIAILLGIPLLAHYYLSKVSLTEEDSTGQYEFYSNHRWLPELDNVDKLKGMELKKRIEELLRIKYTVSVELRELEEKRQHLQNGMSLLSRKLEEAKSEATRRRSELERIQISLQQAKVAEKEAMERNTPRLGRPKPLPLLNNIVSYPAPNSKMFCNMDSCFDYSLCPFASKFRFYLYNSSITSNKVNEYSKDVSEMFQILENSPLITQDYVQACLFFVLITECDLRSIKNIQKRLPRWLGDGRNHVIWLMCELNIPFENFYSRLGRAIVIANNVEISHFRPQFDLVISKWENSPTHGPVWSQLPSLVPAKRKYLATYLGSEIDHNLESELLKIQQQDPISFVFQFSCDFSHNGQNSNIIDKKSDITLSKGSSSKLATLCDNEMLRTRLLLDSTFSLIVLSSEKMDIASTPSLQDRLYESLKYGAIPIILGARFKLPFEEVIDWSQAVYSVSSARITELHYVLKSFTDSDILRMRKHGRWYFENYMSTKYQVFHTTLATLRTRLGIPPEPYQDFKSYSVFNNTFSPLKTSSFSMEPEDDENLGPIEPAYPSESFVRNFTVTSLQKYSLWNHMFQPFRLLPYTPWDVEMPSEAKFIGSSVGFRPIDGGSGGSGKEFSESIGGNVPKEQFTIVMLTFEREQVLLNSLQRLYALPYLHKVVVVWNSFLPPSPSLRWPEVGVPIEIIQAEKNSLNNRFIPYDAIETEAILSIDDDAHLRHDEIVFGFRVWRENRDRIVGFPGRFHAWDLNHGNWLYNSNYSCELSMVLTGAAFYHKMYSYLYTYDMPQAIRDKVDEMMNCEDIAMNFLISHVTQKPPVKVTSRWTFRCPGCPVTLSEEDSHFQERHSCINFFTKVYGYTPLLFTQFRADSILFKTRIPHDKQKCFKYI